MPASLAYIRQQQKKLKNKVQTADEMQKHFMITIS